MEKKSNEKDFSKLIREGEPISRPLGCRCPSCGLTIENTEGRRCNEQYCPTCKMPMEPVEFTKRIG